MTMLVLGHQKRLSFGKSSSADAISPLGLYYTEQAVSDLAASAIAFT